jgi:hypothetical protein
VPAPLQSVDQLRGVEFTDALLHLQGLIGARVKLSVNLYGRFFGCAMTGTLSRVETLPPDHAAIVIVLDSRQALFLDPGEVECFIGRGEGGELWLEFRIAPDASATIERDDVAEPD